MSPPTAAPPSTAPAPVPRGRVDLRDLRIVQLREGRDGAPRPRDAADMATVLHIMRADLARLESSDRQPPHD